MSKSFTVILRSANKRSGNNNNYEIVVPFLRNKNYDKLALRSAFYTKPNDYQDITGGYTKRQCEVRLNFPNNSSFDSREQTANFLTLGIANQAGTTTNIHYWYDVSQSFQHVIDYPSSDTINVQVRAINTQASGTNFFVMSNGTTNDLTDMGEHYLYLEFTGIL